MPFFYVYDNLQRAEELDRSSEVLAERKKRGQQDGSVGKALVTLIT